jgi:hypothetical protein
MFELMLDTLQGLELDALASTYGLSRHPTCISEGIVLMKDELFREYIKQYLRSFNSIPPIFGRWTPSSPSCECGSEKAKIPGHSTWCPKYEV